MEQFSFMWDEQEIVLKPLQKLALYEIRKAMAETKRLIFQAGCGFGKTVLAAAMAKSAVEKGKRVVFITDRIILTNQTSDMFQFYGIRHGVLQAQNARFDIHQPCQVCNIQTLKKRGCPPADLIIIDECHVLFSEHKKIMEENPNAYVLGLSATPYSKGLGKYFTRHIEPITVKQLIQNGYMVPLEAYGPSMADLNKLKIRAGEFTEESVAEAFDKVDIIGNVVETWKKITPGKKTIIFGANIAHIKHIVDQFTKEGISAGQINAYQDEDERKEIMSSFVDGDMTVLCSVEAAVKGFDCPSVEVCVLAVATRSMIKLAQTTGRAMRIFPGKEKAILIDCGGNIERLGFPDEFSFLGLDDGKKKTSKAKEKKEKKPKACPSCDFIKPVGVRTCPACGFTPELRKNVDTSEGDLQKLQRKAKKEYSIEEKQMFISQLNQYAYEHNMRRSEKGNFGWACHAFREKFGCWPSGKINWAARMPVGDEVRRYITYKNIKYAKRQAAIRNTPEQISQIADMQF